MAMSCYRSCASQRRVTSPWAAWNARTVGSPGGGTPDGTCTEADGIGPGTASSLLVRHAVNQA